jgi:hypothetical protein
VERTQQKDTIESLNEYLENQESMHNEPTSVEELLLEGAKHYYGMCGYIQQDYVTKAQVRESLDSGFDQFYQQPIVIEAIEEFAKSQGIECKAVYFAIEQRKEEFVTYLQDWVDEIAEAANGEEDED